MAVHLVTVTSCTPTEDGLRVSPGVPLEVLSGNAEMSQFMSNGPVELRRPDGTVMASRLVHFGASVYGGEDGSLYAAGDDSGPKLTIVFTLSPELRPEDVPPGTELWAVTAGPGASTA